MSYHTHGAIFEYSITLSRAFASKHSIEGHLLDYCEVVAESSWYLELASLCWGCYCNRWPKLAAEFEEIALHLRGSPS